MPPRLGLQNSSDRFTALYGAAASLKMRRQIDGCGCAVSNPTSFPASTYRSAAGTLDTRGVWQGMKMRTVNADDEELARHGLRVSPSDWGTMEVICECRNGRETVDADSRSRPDFVFLEQFRCRVRRGFDVISGDCGNRTPRTLFFVTAYDKFALQAFEVHALDYLLKPRRTKSDSTPRWHMYGKRCHTPRTTSWFSACASAAADLQVTTSPSGGVGGRSPGDNKVNGRIVVIQSNRH